MSTLESGINALLLNIDKSLLYKINFLMAKLEKLLNLNEEEIVSVYIDEMLRQNDERNAVRVLSERISLLKDLCSKFAGYNLTDTRFYELYSFILNKGKDALYEHMLDNFNQYYVTDTENANRLLRSYNRTLYWGALDYWSGNYELIQNRAESLINNANAMLWMYISLEDYTSKEVMYHIIHNWVTFSHATLDEMPRNHYSQYFDYDIIGGSGGEVFVDAGAFKGDTVEAFVKNFNYYKKIYSYEITPKSFEELKLNILEYENVICRQCGIANKKCTMYIDECEDLGGNRLANTGRIEVPVVTLDEDIKENIDFIKMDIEGAEYEALIGAKKHIENEHPKLAIAAYHNNVDIFRLAQLINEMDARYRFYYRYYGSNLYPFDYVLYAV